MIDKQITDMQVMVSDGIQNISDSKKEKDGGGKKTGKHANRKVTLVNQVKTGLLGLKESVHNKDAKEKIIGAINKLPKSSKSLTSREVTKTCEEVNKTLSAVKNIVSNSALDNKETLVYAEIDSEADEYEDVIPKNNKKAKLEIDNQYEEVVVRNDKKAKPITVNEDPIYDKVDELIYDKAKPIIEEQDPIYMNVSGRSSIVSSDSGLESMSGSDSENNNSISGEQEPIYSIAEDISGTDTPSNDRPILQSIDDYRAQFTRENDLDRFEVLNFLKDAPFNIRRELLRNSYITAGNVSEEAIVAIKCAHCLGKVTSSNYNKEALKEVLEGHKFYTTESTPWADLARQFLLDNPSDSAQAEEITTKFLKNWNE